MYYHVVGYDIRGVTKCIDGEIFMWVGDIYGDGDVFITDRDFNLRTSIDCTHIKFMNIDLAKRIKVSYCRAPTYSVMVSGTSTRGEPLLMSGSPVMLSYESLSTYEFEVFAVSRTIYQIPKYLHDLFKLPQVHELGVARDMIIVYMHLHQVLLPELARVIVLMCCELYRRLDYATYTAGS